MMSDPEWEPGNENQQNQKTDTCLSGSREMIVTWEYTLCRTIALQG